MTSSGTSGQAVSKIYLDQETASLQSRVLTNLMRDVTGPARLPMLIIDAPSSVKNRTNFSARGAGIIGFSKAIALELGSRNIRSNVIAPGFIETEMTEKLSEDVVQKWREGIPLKRGGAPEDVANACVFLASDLSNYITGQVLQVDGGMLT